VGNEGYYLGQHRIAIWTEHTAYDEIVHQPLDIHTKLTKLIQLSDARYLLEGAHAAPLSKDLKSVYKEYPEAIAYDAEGVRILDLHRIGDL